MNSSAQAPDSKQLLPGDLVMVMKAMNTAVSNMNAKQRMSAAKVKEALSFCFVVHLTFLTVQSPILLFLINIRSYWSSNFVRLNNDFRCLF